MLVDRHFLENATKLDIIQLGWGFKCYSRVTVSGFRIDDDCHTGAARFPMLP